jgi:hypothetical protein
MHRDCRIALRARLFYRTRLGGLGRRAYNVRVPGLSAAVRRRTVAVRCEELRMRREQVPWGLGGSSGMPPSCHAERSEGTLLIAKGLSACGLEMTRESRSTGPTLTFASPYREYRKIAVCGNARSTQDMAAASTLTCARSLPQTPRSRPAGRLRRWPHVCSRVGSWPDANVPARDVGDARPGGQGAVSRSPLQKFFRKIGCAKKLARSSRWKSGPGKGVASCLVASVAWPPATAGAKRTQPSRGVGY